MRFMMISRDYQGPARLGNDTKQGASLTAIVLTVITYLSWQPKHSRAINQLMSPEGVKSILDGRVQKRVPAAQRRRAEIGSGEQAVLVWCITKPASKVRASWAFWSANSQGPSVLIFLHEVPPKGTPRLGYITRPQRSGSSKPPAHGEARSRPPRAAKSTLLM